MQKNRRCISGFSRYYNNPRNYWQQKSMNFQLPNPVSVKVEKKARTIIKTTLINNATFKLCLQQKQAVTKVKVFFLQLACS